MTDGVYIGNTDKYIDTDSVIELIPRGSTFVIRDGFLVLKGGLVMVKTGTSLFHKIIQYSKTKKT